VIFVDYTELKNRGFMRQAEEGRLSMRMRVVGGNVDADKLIAIAKASEKFGKGYVHLTSRQSIEIPHIKLEDVDAIQAELESKNVFTGFCGPRVRTVTACQGVDVCPAGCIDTMPLARAIADRYAGRVLPHKFKIGITACPNNCLKAEENDVGIKGVYAFTLNREKCKVCNVCSNSCRRNAITRTSTAIKVNKRKCKNCGNCVKSCPVGAFDFEPGYVLSFGGTFGNNIAKGKQVFPIIHDTEILLTAIDSALDFFDKYATTRERFRTVIEREGWEKFRTEMKNAL
jgi:dissimilatory sulfite reductase (desulfoviridin) alpha/beta subunit